MVTFRHNFHNEPQTGHLEAGAEAEDHVGLLRGPAGARPVDGPGNRAALAEVDDGVLQRAAADVAPPHRGVPATAHLYIMLTVGMWYVVA